jgi:spermidine synthase
VLIMGLGFTQKVQVTQAETIARTARPTLTKMALWVFLAAVPSSLMMGVTSYLSTDVATAPFLWVVPLALYLLTFIIAFGNKAMLSPKTTLLVQAIAAALCLYFIPFQGLPIPMQLSVHLLCFFLTALMCHSALSAAKPEPDHLTLFYLCVSLGGVIGGSFNAFLTPVIFPTVIEYPLVMVLACLARPQGFSAEVFRLKKHEIACLAAGVIAGVTGLWLATQLGDNQVTQTGFKITCFIAIGAALVLRDRGLWMAVLLGLVAAGGQIGETGRVLHIERSFFGVSKIIETNDPVLGPVRKMVHGITLHGAQAISPDHECETMTYYNPSTAIGQTITGLEATHPSMDMAVVGLGAGAMANYVRAGDRLAFYEIDPVVAKLANDPKYFTYTSHCAKGPLSFHMGDARLTLSPLPTHQLDLLMVDAFSSDAVPAHLLTVESVKMYLSKVKPGGVVLFHLSNRHLELRDPVIAAIAEAGGVSLQQKSIAANNNTVETTSSVVVIASPTPEGLAHFHADPRWTTRDPGTVKAWTDDYMNVIGAMLRHKNDNK